MAGWNVSLLQEIGKEGPEGHCIFSSTFDPALNSKVVARHVKKEYHLEIYVTNIDISLPGTIPGRIYKNIKKSRAEIPVFFSEKKNVQFSCKYTKKIYDDSVSECMQKYNKGIILENLVSWWKHTLHHDSCSSP